MKKTRLVPGYQVRSKVAIYASGNQAEAVRVWRRFTELLEEGRMVYLEYGLLLGYEDQVV